MNNYGALILATVRSTEFAADAAAARLAATTRERSPDQPVRSRVERAGSPVELVGG